MVPLSILVRIFLIGTASADEDWIFRWKECNLEIFVNCNEKDIYNDQFHGILETYQDSMFFLHKRVYDGQFTDRYTESVWVYVWVPRAGSLNFSVCVPGINFSYNFYGNFKTWRSNLDLKKYGHLSVIWSSGALLITMLTPRFGWFWFNIVV